MSTSGFAQVDLLQTTGQINPRYRLLYVLHPRSLKTNGYIGTLSEKSDHDPGFRTDSSTDAILLEELKSIIQEHSSYRPSSIPRAI